MAHARPACGRGRTARARDGRARGAWPHGGVGALGARAGPRLAGAGPVSAPRRERRRGAWRARWPAAGARLGPHATAGPAAAGAGVGRGRAGRLGGRGEGVRGAATAAGVVGRAPPGGGPHRLGARRGLAGRPPGAGPNAPGDVGGGSRVAGAGGCRAPRPPGVGRAVAPMGGAMAAPLAVVARGPSASARPDSAHRVRRGCPGADAPGNRGPGGRPPLAQRTVLGGGPRRGRAGAGGRPAGDGLGSARTWARGA